MTLFSVDDATAALLLQTLYIFIIFSYLNGFSCRRDVCYIFVDTMVKQRGAHDYNITYNFTNRLMHVNSIKFLSEL